MPSPTQTTGRRAEDLARDHLQVHGLTCLARNFRCRRGEIDLIMKEGETIVFVEVRTRRSTRFGSAEESIDWRKQQKIIATALHFLHVRRLHSCAVRFDVITLSGNEDRARIRWIRDAFMAG
ncbi:MAG TPA: YraN family protein [Gammaproteobacteria bacterium]|nr:YraN family protein [Gammaproteobacteria bacterium]